MLNTIPDTSWGALLNRQYLPQLLTLSGALWLHASNSMLAATTMPSAVREIGGIELISWTFALYLAGSIAAASSSSTLVARYGLRHVMLRAALVYVVGCVVVATAVNMPVLLVGRSLQGLGGGTLVALVFIAQDRFFPTVLIPRSVALLSAVWTSAAFAGPMIGGAFATWDLWRGAYWAFALQGLLLVPAVRILLPKTSRSSSPRSGKIPFIRISLLVFAILSFAASAAYFSVMGSLLLIVAGIVAIGLFFRQDQRPDDSRIMPSGAAVVNHAIFNGLLGTFLLCLSSMSFLVYGPFLLMELYSLTPFQAGLVVMLEALGWGVGAIVFSGIKPRHEAPLVRFAAMLTALMLAAMAVAMPAGFLWWVVMVSLCSYLGLGAAWGHIIKRIIAVAESADKDRASAVLPITQQLGFALGAALSGLLANSMGLEIMLDPMQLQAISFWLFFAFIPTALLGSFFIWRFSRLWPAATPAGEQPV